MLKMLAYIQRGFSNVTYTIASSPRQVLTTKIPTMHFAMVGWEKGSYGSWEKKFLCRIRQICSWKGKCV